MESLLASVTSVNESYDTAPAVFKVQIYTAPRERCDIYVRMNARTSGSNGSVNECVVYYAGYYICVHECSFLHHCVCEQKLLHADSTGSVHGIGIQCPS